MIKKVIIKKGDVKKPSIHKIRLHIAAGEASPKPPIGPALSQHKVQIVTFCKAFNDQTQHLKGTNTVLPVDIYVSEGGKYTLKIGQELASNLIKKVLKLEKGSSTPGREKFQEISREQLREAARLKQPDLNVCDEEAAINTLSGTARSMGIKIID